jgi:large-conductance mechanosensitive channel
MSLREPTICSVIESSNSGAKFAWAALDSLEINQGWGITEDDFTNYFIIGSFVCCFAGSLPKKITVLRYFTFITAVINLLLGALLIYQINPVKDRYIQDAKLNPQESKAPQFFDYKLDKNIFGSYCLSLFSAVNQFSVVNVLTEFKKPTQRRVNKVGPHLVTLVGVQISNNHFDSLHQCSIRWLLYLWL